MSNELGLDLSSICDMSLWTSDDTAYAEYSGGSFGMYPSPSDLNDWTIANPKYTNFFYSQCDIICDDVVQDNYVCTINNSNPAINNPFLRYYCSIEFGSVNYNDGVFNCILPDEAVISNVSTTSTTTTTAPTTSVLAPTTSVLAPTTTSVSTIPTNDLESGSGEYPSDDSTNLFITVGAAGAVVVAAAVAATAITACCIYKYRKSQSVDLMNDSERGDAPSSKVADTIMMDTFKGNVEGEGIEGITHVELS